MSLSVSAVHKSRESVLRTFMRLFLVIFVITALAIAYFSWQRSVDQSRQRLSHISQLMAEGMRSHLLTFELVLKNMAEELVYRDAFNDPPAGDAFLARAQEADIGLVGYGLMDLEGNFVAASTRDLRAPLPNLVSHGQTRESFQRIIEDQRFHIGRPYFFEAVGEWIIPLRVPVYAADGELLGVLTAGNQIDGGAASWARMPVSSVYSLSIVRDDGYLNYVQPLPADPSELEGIFAQQLSLEMYELVHAGEGFHSLSQRLMGQQESTIAWVQPLEDYDLKIVATMPQRIVRQTWLHSMVTPMTLWAIFALIIFLGYYHARRLLRKADQDVREKQAALQHSIAQYHELTRLIPIGVFQFRLAQEGGHQMTYTSERFRKILGLSLPLPVSTSLAEHVYKQIHPEDALDFFKQQSFATKHQREFYWEGRLLQATGERWVSVHSVPGEAIDEQTQLWNGVVADITERKAAEAQINLLAYYDALTQLPNRRLLRQRLERAIRLAVEQTEFAALLFIDVDKFKQLNDSFGHAQGDRMLREVGQRLEALVRDYDTVARLGGDEFVVLLTRLSTADDKAATQVEVVLQKIERLLNEPFEVGEQQVQISLSTGIALIDGQESSIDILLQQADQAMYRAKEAGRNTQCFYDAHIQQIISEQLELQQELRDAISGEQLELHYQTKVNQLCEVAGVEALIRWHHPQRGVINPGTFIPIAEQSDDIVHLGNWILQRACEQLVAWQHDAERADWTIAVNVSVRQLRAPDFAEKVLITLAETGARANRLVLEITESMLMVDTEQVIEKMARLKRVGVKFSLDDFGTGYSSLGYLNRLPIDELKIDQSFVRDMDTDEHHHVLIRTILSLGNTLSLTTIAEGVETYEQFETLRDLGCELFQGFYFSKPQPITKLNQQDR